MIVDGINIEETGFAVEIIDSISDAYKLVISNKITMIGDYSFWNCLRLKKVIIPNSVTSIEEWAFAGSGITSIIIPYSVTSIGNSAFNGCTNLTTIYYNGTAAGYPWGAPKLEVES